MPVRPSGTVGAYARASLRGWGAIHLRFFGCDLPLFSSTGPRLYSKEPTITTMRTSITTFIRQSSSLVISLLLCSCSTRIDTARLNLAEQSIPKSLPLDLVNKIIIQENAISAVRNPFSTLRRGLSFSHNRASSPRPHSRSPRLPHRRPRLLPRPP